MSVTTEHVNPITGDVTYIATGPKGEFRVSFTKLVHDQMKKLGSLPREVRYIEIKAGDEE